MIDKYFTELFDILNCVFFENGKKFEKKHTEIYEKYFSENIITIDRILFVSYCREVKNSLYQLNDNNGREAYLSNTFYLLSYSEFFEQNKDLIKGLNDIYEELPIKDLLKCVVTEKYKKQPVYNKLLHSLFKEMFLLEHTIKEFCNDFNIDFNKLAKKYNHRYDFQNLMYYIKTGETQQTQPENNPLTPPPQTTFSELFKPPYNSETKIKDLKDILKRYKHIDNNEKWTGTTTDKNELATLYWLFEEKNNILNPGKVTPQLKAFYKEFGLIVYTDKEPKGYCSLKNISIPADCYSSTYKHFSKIFHTWINTI